MDMERWIEKQTISLGRRVGKECEESRFDDQVFDGDAAYSPAHVVPISAGIILSYQLMWSWRGTTLCGLSGTDASLTLLAAGSSG